VTGTRAEPMPVGPSGTPASNWSGDNDVTAGEVVSAVCWASWPATPTVSSALAPAG
jgi:hypothetical protein